MIFEGQRDKGTEEHGSPRTPEIRKNYSIGEDFSFFPRPFSLFFVPLHQLCEKSLAGACGGIGRRARLRI